jgi:predicted secreted protein
MAIVTMQNMRRAWLRHSLVWAGLAALALMGEAAANDAAARRILGFSPDGRYFAFEQYGTLDWSESDSGYSEIAILDTQNDTFVGGKPIAVIDDAHQGTLTQAQARQRAAALAAPILAKYSIAPRGERVAFDPFTFPDQTLARDELFRLESISQKALSSQTYVDPRVSTFQLEETLADSAADCVASSLEGSPAIPPAKARGFRLLLQGVDGKSSIRLHEDKAVPASRDCPTSYSLAEAYYFEPKVGAPVVAVLVQRFSQGWEGRDRRFIAVTSPLR